MKIVIKGKPKGTTDIVEIKRIEGDNLTIAEFESFVAINACNPPFLSYYDITVEEDTTTPPGEDPIQVLARAKKFKYDQIDYKTAALIAGGFTFDGRQFSLSLYAQANWHALKDNTSEFTWPKDVTTIDNDTYSLAESDVVGLWQAGKTALDSHLESGRLLKKQVFDAADVAAVLAVVDTR